MSPQNPLPRDKDSLLRELNARIRIKDIKSFYRLRDEVSVKWYESLLILLLFVSTLGFLAFVVLLLMNDSAKAVALLQRAILVWSIPLVLTFVLTIEVVLGKLNSLRKLNEVFTHLIEEIQKHQDEGHSEANGQPSTKTSPDQAD